MAENCFPVRPRSLTRDPAKQRTFAEEMKGNYRSLNCELFKIGRELMTGACVRCRRTVHWRIGLARRRGSSRESSSRIGANECRSASN